MGDFLEEQGGVAGAGGHFAPEAGDEHGEALGGVFDFFEEVAEAGLGEQAYVFGKHGEEAALEETGDDLRFVPGGFEGFGEAVGDVAGDLGGDFRRIERVGIGEDEAEAVADFGFPQVRQQDAVVGGIGEALVAPTGAGELGVEVDGMADVADDEEWRAAMGRGEVGDVVAALVVGTLEGAESSTPCLVSQTKWAAL